MGESMLEASVRRRPRVFCILKVHPDYAFKSGPGPIPVDAGNINGDGMVNSSDIIQLVNYVFKSGAAAA